MTNFNELVKRPVRFAKRHSKFQKGIYILFGETE